MDSPVEISTAPAVGERLEACMYEDVGGQVDCNNGCIRPRHTEGKSEGGRLLPRRRKSILKNIVSEPSSFLISRAQVGSWLVSRGGVRTAHRSRATGESKGWPCFNRGPKEGSPHALNGLPRTPMGESGDAPSEVKLAAKEKEKKGVLFLSSSFPCAPPVPTPSMLATRTFGSLGVRPRVYQSQIVFGLAVGDR